MNTDFGLEFSCTDRCGFIRAKAAQFLFDRILFFLKMVDEV